MKRAILIVIIVILVAVLCVGLYFFFFAPKAGPSIGTQANPVGSLPAAGNQNNPAGANNSSTAAANPTLAENFGVISNSPVLDYFVDAANTVTAIEPDGEIIQVMNGQSNTINSIAIQNIMSAGFSYDGTKILVNFGDPADPQTSVFDIPTKAWTPLPEGLISPTWSPSDYRVTYYTRNANGTQTFATIDASKAKPTPVALITLHAQDVDLTWLSKSEIAFSTKPSLYAPGSTWIFNLQASTLSPASPDTTEVSGLERIWSSVVPAQGLPESLVFVASPSGLGGYISLTDSLGNLSQQLKFVTLPSKCLFTSETSTAPDATGSSTPLSTATTSTPYLYCGVPRDQNALATSRLPDDYNQMNLFTSDDIYRINLESGDIETVFDDASQNLDVSDVKFFNDTLFFINRYDGKLYAISLSA